MTNKNNKNCLITGGSGKIAKVLCKMLVQKGFKVALQYNSSFPECDCNLKIKADFLNQERVEYCFDRCVEELGSVDVLFNMASIFLPNSVESVSSFEFERDFSLHVKAPLLLMKKMLAQKSSHGGHIINVTDVNVVRDKTSYFSYLLSKQTLSNLTSLASSEFEKKGLFCHEVQVDVFDSKNDQNNSHFFDQIKFLL